MERVEVPDDQICPYLASWWDERAVCRYASGDNRCYALQTRKKVWGLRIGERKPYRYVSKDFQVKICLAGRKESCSSFKKRQAKDGKSA